MRRRLIFRLLAATLAAGVLAVAGCVFWLTQTRHGLSTLLQFGIQSSAQPITLGQLDGTLLGPIDLDRLTWKNEAWQVEAEAIHIEWNLWALTRESLDIAQLHIKRLRIDKLADTPPSPPPTSLRIPLSIQLQSVKIDRIDYGDQFHVDELALSAKSDGRHHELALDHLKLDRISVRGNAALDGDPSLPLTASARIQGNVAERPLVMDIQASGPLARLTVDAVAREGVTGQASLAVAPFARQPVTEAKVALKGVDPAAWRSDVPAAMLDVEAELRPLPPETPGISGRTKIVNRAPGTIDDHRLPIESLAGSFRWTGQNTDIGDFTARLPGGGSLSGRGRWENDELRLAARADKVNAEVLHRQLRPTQLSGPIDAQLRADRQAVQAQLSDPRFSVLARIVHQGQEVVADELRLQASAGSISAKGRLGLSGHQTFTAQGELRQFDPGKVLKAPAGRINADFSVNGQLAPKLHVKGETVIHDSVMADYPVSGQARIDLVWPIVRDADVTLRSGPNQIDARGAFGAPGDRLDLRIAAPQWRGFGVTGDFRGTGSIAGSVDAFTASADLQSETLSLNDGLRLNGLHLQGAIGNAKRAPLRLDLRLDTVDRGSVKSWLRDITATIAGTNDQHRIDLASQIGAQRRAVLGANGGVDLQAAAPQWSGQLTDARLTEADGTPLIRLTEAAPLTVSQNAWRIGPARFTDANQLGNAELIANADARQLSGKLSARGPRIGKLDGKFEAGMKSPWEIDRQRPWTGQLLADVSDLSWLADLLGSQWKSAGQLKGDVVLRGTPEAPDLNGTITGKELSLRLPDQGLELVQGKADITLKNNRLRVRELRFDSTLRPVPKALRLAYPDSARLADQPGKLAVTGEMLIDQQSGSESATLDLSIERLGLFQLSDQWIAASGSGRLAWQGGNIDITANATVDAGYWQLAASGAPRLNDDIVIKQSGRNAKTETPTRTKADIRVDLGSQFLFSGAGLSSRLRGDVRWRASGQDLPRASGSIRLEQGRFEAYGQQLEIERGIFTFQGLLDNPAIDVRAWRRGLPVEAGLDVSGTVKKPIVKLISEPDLPEPEKFTWLVLGHGPEQMSPADAAVLVSAAGNAVGLGAGSANYWKKTLGIDEFTLRQGSVTDSVGRTPTSRVAGSGTSSSASSENQTFSVGKRISANTVLAYEQTLGTAESIVKLTHNLTRRLAVIGRVGSDNAVDIFYSFTADRP